MVEYFGTLSEGTNDAFPEPATYPPMGEDAETPWLPSDPIPNPEPVSPALGEPDPGIYEGTSTAASGAYDGIQ